MREEISVNVATEKQFDKRLSRAVEKGKMSVGLVSKESCCFVLKVMRERFPKYRFSLRRAYSTFHYFVDSDVPMNSYDDGFIHGFILNQD